MINTGIGGEGSDPGITKWERVAACTYGSIAKPGRDDAGGKAAGPTRERQEQQQEEVTAPSDGGVQKEPSRQ